MVLTDYDNEMFNKIASLNFNTYYTIRLDRPDVYDFYEMLKKRIDLFGDFEFSNDYTQFKRIIPYKQEYANNTSGLMYQLNYFKEDEVPTYDISKYNLPILIKAPTGKRR